MCVEYFKATGPKHNKHITTTCGIPIDRSGSSITGFFFLNIKYSFIFAISNHKLHISQSFPVF